MQRRKFLTLAGAAAIAPALPAPVLEWVDLPMKIEPGVLGGWHASTTGLYTKTGNYVAVSGFLRWSKPEDPTTWSPAIDA